MQVYLPASYNKSAAVKQLYPVIYLFDGNAHYAAVISMLKQLRENSDSDGKFPEMIVVAIKSSDRANDFTPTSSLIGPDGNVLDMLKRSGGGDNFTAFIEKELIPYIQSNYPAAPYKILAGHSLGGLAAVNILLHNPKMFDAYIAVDPSMWWDGNKILNEARLAFRNNSFAGTSLFIGIANTLPKGINIEEVKDDASGPTNHIRSVLALADILENNPGNGLKWDYKYYPDKDHGSVAAQGINDGLRFLFDAKMPNEVQLQ